MYSFALYKHASISASVRTVLVLCARIKPGASAGVVKLFARRKCEKNVKNK